MNEFVKKYIESIPKPVKGMSQKEIIFSSTVLWAAKQAGIFVDQNPNLPIGEGLACLASMFSNWSEDSGSSNGGTFFAIASDTVIDMFDQYNTERLLYLKNKRRGIYE